MCVGEEHGCESNISFAILGKGDCTKIVSYAHRDGLASWLHPAFKASHSSVAIFNSIGIRQQPFKSNDDETLW